MESKLSDIQEQNMLFQALGVAKEIVSRDYLYQLDKYMVSDLPEELKNINIGDYLRLYKFTKFVSDKNESIIDKIVTVLNSVYVTNATLVMLLVGHVEYTEYYMGVVSKDIRQKNSSVDTQGKVLKGALKGNFAGVQLEQVKGSKKKELLDEVFQNNNYVTGISGIASIRKEKDSEYKTFVQGLEHLVDAVQGQEYSLLMIADPVNAQQLAETKSAYENLYTQFAQYHKYTFSFSETESVTHTNTRTEGITQTIGKSISDSQGISQTNGWSESFTKGESTNKNIGSDIGTIAGAAIAAGALAVTGEAAAPFVPLIMGATAAVGDMLIGSKGESTSQTVSENQSSTQTSTYTSTDTESESVQESESQSEALGTTQGKTTQITTEDKHVKVILDKIEKQLERIDRAESYGAFNCAAYVISNNQETNDMVASGYNALMRGDNSALQASYINKWEIEETETTTVLDYLKVLSHPVFVYPYSNNVVVNPASISNSYEVAVTVGLPKKSISGLPVLECTPFGRDIFTEEKEDTSLKHIELGNVYHMGATEKRKVELDLDSLTMHTFITGSTGSGKSNAVYSLLEKVLDAGEQQEEKITFMVIEPAKGEYKDKFGSYESVSVYGTNPKKTEMLRINPFSFPEDIHVLEHIDRLVEIFNVCWPMYAAMPAVLKDAMERAYVLAGWNLEKSETKYKDEHGKCLYPGFVDVLQQVNVVMNESKYSADSKGDYIGALCTRIKSLTNGIYGKIFVAEELTYEELYDRNVIVDLSRVGAVETKSLLMGLLVMKMQEYRMSAHVSNNSGLRHLTILEEAHNLLKRTSSEQSAESSNLMGKSVEMLANSIAEMRTYGEGFVIVDQAPGLLDMAAIRNTNTKIILRLPEISDRELVGKAASLSDDQIVELAKLKVGVAAVYQNNWIEPVLCKINRCRDDEKKYSYIPDKKEDKATKQLVEYLLLTNTKKMEVDTDIIKNLEKMIFSLNGSISSKLDLMRYLKEKDSKVLLELRMRIVYSMFNSEEALSLARFEANDISRWDTKMQDVLVPNLDIFEETERDKIITLILAENALQRCTSEDTALRDNYVKYITEGVKHGKF